MGDDKQLTDDVGLSDDLELDGDQADGVKGGAALVLDGVTGATEASADPTLLRKVNTIAK